MTVMTVIKFEKILPSWWNPAGTPFAKWPLQAPLVDPIPGKVNIQKPVKAGQSAASLLARGATHINVTKVPSGESVPATKLFSGEVGSQTLFSGLSYTIKAGGSATNGKDKVYNEADVKERGRSYGNYPIVMFESMENGEWDADSTVMGWVLDGVKERQDQLFGVGVGLRTHNYYSVWGGYDSNFWFKHWLNDVPMNYEFVYRYPQSEWATQKPGVTIPSLFTSGKANLSMEAHYRHHNYNEIHYLPSERFRMQLAKKIGLKAGLIVRPDNENIGFSTVTNLTSPAGVFARKGASPLDPSDAVSSAFFAWWDADLFALWHNPLGKPDNVNNLMTPYDTTPDVWIPQGGAKVVGRPPAGFTYSSDANDRWYGGHSNHYDYHHFGLALYRTAMATEGGTKGTGAYKIDGGAWVEPNPYGAEILHAQAYKRGMFEYRIKDNTITVVYWNHFADNNVHEVTLRNPLNTAITWSGKVFGKFPYVKTFQL